jgi:UDP-glucose 4-epimerase
LNGNAVLLLGGGGFIGSALAQRLQQEELPTYIIGRNNGDELARLLPMCGTVVHLASTTTPGSSALQPRLELANLGITLQLLDLLQAKPQTHLIYFSSGGTVYGNPAQLPVREDCPMAPTSYHAAAKVAQESFCAAQRAQGLPITILRPSNAYGPDQTLRKGFGLIRTMFEHARLGTALEIWGDGENVRDFIHIDDIVEPTLRLIRRPQDSGTYNLGSGVGFSVNQVKTAVEVACNMPLNAIYCPARDVDVRNVVLDNTRLAEQLNWQPTITLAQGLESTWRTLRQTTDCRLNL